MARHGECHSHCASSKLKSSEKLIGLSLLSVLCLVAYYIHNFYFLLSSFFFLLLSPLFFFLVMVVVAWPSEERKRSLEDSPECPNGRVFGRLQNQSRKLNTTLD